MESAKHLYEVEGGNSTELFRSRERSVKVRKFLFNILWRFGAMEENPEDGSKGRGEIPPSLVWIGLNTWHQHFSWLDKTSLFRNPGITVKFSSFHSSPADVNTFTQKMVEVSKLAQIGKIG